MSRVVCAQCQEEGRDGCFACGKLPGKFGIHHPERGWLVVGGTPRYHSRDSWTLDHTKATQCSRKEADDVLTVMNAQPDLLGVIEVREIPS